MRPFLARRSSNHRIRVICGEKDAEGGNSLTVSPPLNWSHWIALGLSALAITACGGGAASTVTPAKKASTTSSNAAKPTTTPKAQSDTEQLNRLLADRAYALRSGDASGFIATATGAQIAKDKTAIARARALPIKD